VSNEPEYQQYPTDIRLETKFGPVWMSVPSDDHIVVDANKNSATRRFGAEDVPDENCRFMRATSRGHTYDVTFLMHLHRDANGEFIPEHRITTGFCRRHFDERKVPVTLQEDLRLAVMAAVNDWVKEHPAEVGKAGEANAVNTALRLRDRAERQEAKLLDRYVKFLAAAPDDFPGADRAKTITALLMKAGVQPDSED